MGNSGYNSHLLSRYTLSLCYSMVKRDRGYASIMAELVWKNKHLFPTSVSSPSSEYQLTTVATYPHTLASPTTTTVTDSWFNQLILGDDRYILPLLVQKYAAAIDLIYIDPPFMTGRTFLSGTQLAYRDVWKNDLDIYIQWLYEVFEYLHALLSRSGSLYVHLDWRVAHYAKILLDELFSSTPQNEGAGFKNEIIWHYQSGGRSQKHFARKHDTLLLYTKSASYCFRPERIGERRGTQKRNHMRKEIDSEGRVSWTIRSAGRLYTYSEDTLIPPSDVWSDIQHLHQKDPERTGYATQKPEALLERILLVSSDEHDLVLDCFCGSGVTPVVAERLSRRWVACDQSTLALTTTQNRLLKLSNSRPFVLQHLTSSSP